MYLRPLLVLFTILLLFGGFAVHRPQADSKTTISPRVDSIRLVRFELLGLRDSRIPLVEQVLLQVPGVQNFQIEENRKHIVVRFDIDRTNLKQIRDSLRRASFTPVL